MRDRKSLLARLARSASSRAALISSSASFRPVISVEIAQIAYGSPSDPSSGNLADA
jgi:hypothetical protein